MAGAAPNKKQPNGTSPTAANIPFASTTAAANDGNSKSIRKNPPLRGLFALVLLLLAIRQAHVFLTRAYTIRLEAIKDYGLIIHEFDPYFNFRAATYLFDHVYGTLNGGHGYGWVRGWKMFCEWFDYKVWYPLGRPVGTTIYPGMQVTAVWLTKCWLPIWFGLNEKFGGFFSVIGSFFDDSVSGVKMKMVTKSAREVSAYFQASNDPIMSAVASLMHNMGMKWKEMSLNDVCCLMPAWFGALTTLVTGFLALECSAHFCHDHGNKFGTVFDDLPFIGYYIRKITTPIRKKLTYYSGLDITTNTNKSSSSLQTASLFSMLATMFFMSIIPAHLMRSVGGGFDNESVAVFAMTLVFYCWTRALRGGTSGAKAEDDCVHVVEGEDNVGAYIREKQDQGFKLSSRTRAAVFYGCVTGIAYFYMVMSWGGYVFVINLVGAHAGTMVLLGRHSSKLHAAYSSFYFVGTALATRVPVVGLSPLRSLEQMGPLLVFLGMQLVEYCERIRTRDNLSRNKVWLLRIRLFGAVGVLVVGIVMALLPTGFFGPISSRVRGLFVKHTKTGNPLVDSVAEHQAAKPEAYQQYLDIVVRIVPIGFGLIALAFTNDASSFLLVYGLAAYFFSHKMVRLILLTAPIASSLGGIAVGRTAAWCMEGICGWYLDVWDVWGLLVDGGHDNVVSAAAVVEAKVVSNDSKIKGKSKKVDSDEVGELTGDRPTSPTPIRNQWFFLLATKFAWLYLSLFLYKESQPYIKSFQSTCQQMASAMSHPSILFKAQTRDGQTILVDDYREAYWWIRDNTPEDSRIMAWWDYGYQITAIANRTTIADGNTWNHEHIALLGRALTSPLKDGHRIARHLADYVLLWTGGGGDDVAKSPHLARIANSVYRNMCPGDPTCSSWSSSKMQQSLLYKLHSNGLVHGVEVDRNRFKEVYQSKHGKVRIYKIMSVSKESKEWVPKHRLCDAPGSWFCPGQYPPGLQKVLKEKKDFRQLEDFNAKAEDDSEYQKKYFEHLSDPEKAKRRAEIRERKERERAQRERAGNGDTIDLDKKSRAKRSLTKAQIREINQDWQDTSITSKLYEIIKSNDIDSLAYFLQEEPHVAHVRSKDGRGPMFWAHEMGRKSIVSLLKTHGVSEKLRDKDGITPLELGDDEL